MPANADVRQFHALVFFAIGDYDRAAAVAHAVLEGGPGWDWNTLQSLLKKAVAACYKDVAHLKKDRDLDTLRDRADFKKLIAELERGQPKSR